MNNKNLSTKEVAAKVREELKKELPNCKFSVTYQGYSGGSSIDLNLMAGPLPALEEDKTYAQINQYMLREESNDPFRNNGCTLTPFGLETLRKAYQVISQYHWDDSEPQVDYFSCNFYIHLGVGNGSKDYLVKEKK